MTVFWKIILVGLVVILAAMLILMLIRKTVLDKLNYILAMNTVIIMLILTVGFIDGRQDMYVDIAMSYSILGFVTSVILAKYIGGRRR